MLPTTPANIDSYFARLAADGAGEGAGRLSPATHAAARWQAIGADAMFVAPTWAFADAYSAHAPTYVYRFDHAPLTLRALGLGAAHGSEIVHILHTLRLASGPAAAPAGQLAARPRWAAGCSGPGWTSPPRAGRAARAGVQDWPCYDTARRATRVIRSASDVMVDDPDAARRSAWEGVY